MTDVSPDEPIRFYFSFRSPYAWLAAERLEDEVGDLGVAVERLPIYPPSELFPNDPTGTPAKARYLAQDVRRLTRERGLSLRFPPSPDTDWSLSHAAALGTRDDPNGHRLVVEIFRQRFSEGRDLGEDDVIGEAARRAGFDADAVLAMAHDDALQEAAAEGWRQGMERDQIFGVPSFVYAGKLYFGQDRMHFLRDAVIRKSAPRSA